MFCIEIKTRPNINGNCKRLYIRQGTNDSENYRDVSEDYFPSDVSFQVTPQEFKQWKELAKNQAERRKEKKCTR